MNKISSKYVLVDDFYLFSRNDNDLMNKVKSLYFGDSEIDNNSFKKLAQILTDAWFQMPAIQTGLKLSEKVTSPIYLYQYGYYGSMNMCDLVNLDMKKFMIKVGL